MVLTKSAIIKSEENAVKSGNFSYRELMFKAGSSAFDIIREKNDLNNKRLAVICGNGNNGGDGFVVAKLFYEHGYDVTVITPMGAPVTENAQFYFTQLRNLKKAEKFTDDYDIIIDAIFGIGLSRAPSEELTELFNNINNSNATKISIDIPSGVEADTGKVFTSAIKADYTITFIARKPCFLLPKGSDFCGDVYVCDIGVAAEDSPYTIIKKPILKKRPRNSHKGTFGTAVGICGSYGMAGAAALSALAALRSGLGIYKAVLCRKIYPIFSVLVPEAVCMTTAQTLKGLLNGRLDIEKITKKCDALLFGCGVGKGKSIDRLLKKILKFSKIPVVIDADGINALIKNINLLKETSAPVILTPHPAEMARLCNKNICDIEEDRINSALSFATEFNCVLVLKGAHTIIATPDGKVRFNITGNSGLATGGSGDLLSGIMVSLLAQGYTPEKAAEYAVYLHGEAADKAALKKGERAMLPRDVLDEL